MPMTPEEEAAMEAELMAMSDSDDEGPMNGAGILYSTLLQEEKRQHSVTQIVTFESVQEEVDEIIPALKKQPNATEDYIDELDEKAMMLNGRMMTLQG